MSSLRQVLKKLLGHTGKNRIDVTKNMVRKKRNGASKGIRRMIVMKNKHCYKHCLLQLQALGVKPVKKVAGVHAVVCRFPAHADMKALKAHAMVRRVEPDRKMKIHVLPRAKSVRVSAACASIRGKQIIPWGISRIQAPKIWDKNQGGSVRVAILDTGISGNHPDLKRIGTYNTIAGAPGNDQNGHGTHVAGTVAALNNKFGVIGAAPRARLYAVKAFGKDGTAFISDIVQGLDWCIRNNMQVVNMSFGTAEASATIKELIQRAYKKGIVLVASAGNNGSGSGQIDFPGRLPEVIAVAASTKAGGIAGFSSRGSGISVAAPGVQICSTIPGKAYTPMDGTSMAAPHITGTAALLLAKKSKLTPGRIRQVLRQTAVRLNGYSARDQGAGLVQARRALDRI